MNKQPASSAPEPVHKNIWIPTEDPQEDYPLTEPSPPPASTAGEAVVFPAPGKEETPNSDFQDFVWDVVNAISRVNSGLFAFKKGVAMGLDPELAKGVYLQAVANYRDLFVKWDAEMKDDFTWIQVAISPDGYVMEVVVRSRAFAIHTPGQSESHNSTNPPRRR